MRRFLVFFVALVVLVSGLWYADTHLVPPPAAPGTATPLPTRVPERTATPATGAGPRVVVISLDGAQADRVTGYIADGTMPNLARLKGQGALAQYARSVDPSLTAAAHASLATGSYPAATGVVSNRYHRSQDEFYRYVDALDEPYLEVEPVWRTAMRDARRTATVCWPGTSLEVPATLADYTVTYGASDALSAQHEVTFTRALTWTAAPASFSPLREGALTIKKSQVPLATVRVLAVDTTDDSKENYDTYILARSRQVDGQSARLRLGDTQPLVIDDRLLSGAYFSLTQVKPDRAIFYQSGVYYNRAQPNELVREVNRRFGFFPAGADYYALEHGWITPQQYVRMAEVQSRWLISVTNYVLETYKPELLFTWQGAADEMQHQFLMVDAKQPKYGAERAAEYDRYVRRGYALADTAVGELAKALDLTQSTLFVVSDHGMAPIHSQVYVNTILAAQRLLVYESGPDFRVNTTQSKAVAFASGGAAHVYINLRGRERPGIVPEGDYRAVQDAIVQAFEKVKDKDGKPVFASVVRRADLGKLGLEADNAGDVFVQAMPGYTLTDWRGNPAVLGSVEYYGQHGFAASLPEMHGIFLAAGRRIKAGVEVGPVHIVDLAPTVERLLDLKPPATVAGRVLEETLLP